MEPSPGGLVGDGLIRVRRGSLDGCIGGMQRLGLILRALESATNAGQLDAVDAQNFGCGVDVAGTSEGFDMLGWRQRSGAFALLLVGDVRNTKSEAEPKCTCPAACHNPRASHKLAQLSSARCSQGKMKTRLEVFLGVWLWSPGKQMLVGCVKFPQQPASFLFNGDWSSPHERRETFRIAWFGSASCRGSRRPRALWSRIPELRAAIFAS